MTLTDASLGDGLSDVTLDARAHLLCVRGDASRVTRELRRAATAALSEGRTVLIVDLSYATDVGGPIAWELSRAHERRLWRAGQVVVVFKSSALGPLFDAFGLHRSPDVVPTLGAGLAAANVSEAGKAVARGSASELAPAPVPGPPGMGVGAAEPPGMGTPAPGPWVGGAGAPGSRAAAAPPPFVWSRNRDLAASWSFELRAGRESPGLARAAIGRVLTGRVEGAKRHDTLLLVSEAVTNSVVHGGASEAEPIELTVTMSEEKVRVEVVDPAGGFEPPDYPSDALLETGRGLPLIHSLAQSWGVDGRPDGRVWFELARDAA